MLWGGNPEKVDLYLPTTPVQNDGATIYRLTAWVDGGTDAYSPQWATAHLRRLKMSTINPRARYLPRRDSNQPAAFGQSGAIHWIHGSRS